MSDPKYIVRLLDNFWCVFDSTLFYVVEKFEKEISAVRRARILNRQFNKNKLSIRHIAILKLLYRKIVATYSDFSTHIRFENKRGSLSFLKDLKRMELVIESKRMCNVYWINPAKLELVEKYIKPSQKDTELRAHEINMINIYLEAKNKVKEYEEERCWTAPHIHKIFPPK